jgi:hypothetical protein
MRQTTVIVASPYFSRLCSLSFRVLNYPPVYGQLIFLSKLFVAGIQHSFWKLLLLSTSTPKSGSLSEKSGTFVISGAAWPAFAGLPFTSELRLPIMGTSSSKRLVA